MNHADSKNHKPHANHHKKHGHHHAHSKTKPKFMIREEDPKKFWWDVIVLF
jgi:hypothetical protein